MQFPQIGFNDLVQPNTQLVRPIRPTQIENLLSAQFLNWDNDGTGSHMIVNIREEQLAGVDLTELANMKGKARGINGVITALPDDVKVR